jgi:transposase-like protein
MELQQLRYFVAVVEAGGFSRAAARLDEGLKAWREPPLVKLHYLFLDAR